MKRTFEQWLAQVDAIIEARTGMTSMDLPDWDYYSAYDDGVSPKSAALRAIKAAGSF